VSPGGAPPRWRSRTARSERSPSASSGISLDVEATAATSARTLRRHRHEPPPAGLGRTEAARSLPLEWTIDVEEATRAISRRSGGGRPGAGRRARDLLAHAKIPEVPGRALDWRPTVGASISGGRPRRLGALFGVTTTVPAQVTSDAPSRSNVSARALLPTKPTHAGTGAGPRGRTSHHAARLLNGPSLGPGAPCRSTGGGARHPGAGVHLHHEIV
jgi:hypothetical protein